MGSTPPETVIETGPSGTIGSTEVTFAFVVAPAYGVAKVMCMLDSGSFGDCTSPVLFSGLADGPHTVTFRAEDAAGNQDPSPATRDFSVDMTVYKAKIGRVKVSGPKKVKKGKKATYKVKISNTGNIEATGVRLKVSGKGVNSKKSVGKIAAAKTRTVKVKLKPKKPDKLKASFKVTSDNAGGETVKKKIKVKK